MSSPSDTEAVAPGKLAGRLCVLAAALMWSSSGLFVKQALFDGWPRECRGMLFAFWRAAFAAAVLLPMIRRPRASPLLAPLALCFMLMNVTFLTSMARTTAANAIWLQSTYPWWVLVFSVVLFGQPIARRELVPLAFGAAGVGMILFCELVPSGAASAAASAPTRDALGVACGAASGVCYAAVVVLMWRLSSHDPAWLVSLNHAVTALVLLPWVARLGYWPTPDQLVVLAAFGVFQMAIPYLLLIRGLRAIGSQEAAAIGLVEPVLLPVWVLLAGLETPKWWTIAGASLILAGLVLRYGVLELRRTLRR